MIRLHCKGNDVLTKLFEMYRVMIIFWSVYNVVHNPLSLDDGHRARSRKRVQILLSRSGNVRAYSGKGIKIAEIFWGKRYTFQQLDTPLCH